MVATGRMVNESVGTHFSEARAVTVRRLFQSSLLKVLGEAKVVGANG